jgi:hypothetical protein
LAGCKARPGDSTAWDRATAQRGTESDKIGQIGPIWSVFARFWRFSARFRPIWAILALFSTDLADFRPIFALFEAFGAIWAVFGAIFTKFADFQAILKISIISVFLKFR